MPILSNVRAKLNHLVAARLIRERGHSVTGVASALGMDRANLSHCLAGRRQFPAEKIVGLAEALGVNPYELLGPENPRAAVIELARMYDVQPDELAVPA